MFFQATILIAIFLAFTRPESGGDIALASIMVVFSSMFYILMFNAMSGQKEVGLDIEADLNNVWQNRIISIGAMVALYKIEMFSVFYFALPFQLIGLCCDILATGFKLGYLTVEEVDREELPEEEDDNF